MKPLAPRLDRLSRLRLQRPRLELTPDQRRAWCIKLGIDPESILIGRPGSFLVLPPQIDE